MAYHLNPETGKPGLCRASVKPCPFGLPGEHFSTPDEARTAYEAMQEGRRAEPLSWLFTSKNSRLTAPEDQAGFTRACFEEYEGYASQWPIHAEGDWGRHYATPYGLNYYSMGGFAPINAILRGHQRDYYDEEVSSERAELMKDRMAELEEAFSKAPTGRRRLYRYTNLPGLTAQETLTQLEETSIFEDKGYMSTSASMDFPLLKVLQKPEKGRVLLEIAYEGPYIPLQRDEEVRAGDVQSHEHEILLPKGQRFQVVGMDRRRVCEVGILKNTYLNGAPWNRTRAEQKVLNLTEARVPLVRLVVLPADG